MKKLKLLLLAAKIEWTWLLIKKGQKKGQELLNKGCSLSSAELLHQNKLLSKHSVRVIKAQNSYSQLLH